MAFSSSSATVRDTLSRYSLPVTCAVLGGGAFVMVANVDRATQILTLMMMGLWAAALLFSLDMLRQATFFALGFSCVINPRKFFGMPPAGNMPWTFGEASYQFLSFTDLALLILFALMVFGYFSKPAARSAPLIPKWTVLAMIGYAAAMAVSCFNAPDVSRSFAQIVFDCKLFALLLIVGRIFSVRENVEAYLPPFLYGLALACTLEFMVVAAEYFGLLRLRGNILGIPFSSGGSEKLLGGRSMYRVSGTYGHPNYMGAPMAVVALLVWELLIAPRPITRHQLPLWIVWAVTVGVLVMTFSRGAWLALVVAGLCYFPFALKLQGLDWVKRFLKRYALLSLLGITLLGYVFWQPIQMRLFRSDPSAMMTRGLLNSVSFDVIKNNPYFGGGIGNHIMLTKDYRVIKEITRASNAPMPVHSIYLLMITEVGFIGAVLYFLIPLSLYIIAMRRCLAHPRDPLTPVCQAFTSTLMVFWIADGFSPVTRLVDNSYLYWMMMGVLVGIANILSENDDEPELVMVEPASQPGALP